MPTREEMISDIMNAQGSAPSLPAKMGAQAPSREQMIKDIMAHQNNADPGNSDPSWMAPLETATTAGRSYLEGMTLGLSEPVISGVNAGLGTLSDYALGFNDDKDFLGKLKSNYRSDVDDRRRMKAENPYTDLGGQLTGGILPAVASLGSSAAASAPSALRATRMLDVGGAVAKGATAAIDAALGVMLPTKLAGMTNPILTGAGAIAKGGIHGATSALGSEALRQGVLRNTGFIEGNEAPGLGEAASTGMKWGAGLAALPQAYKAAKYLGKKGMSVALGPKVETIDAYLQNADRIRNARSSDDLKEELNQLGAKLQADVEAGRLSKSEANDVIKAVNENIRQVRTEAQQEFSRERHSVSDSVDRAKDQMNDVVRGQQDALRGVRAPLDLSGDVEQAKRQLKTMVSKGSGEAFEILGATKGTSSVDPMVSAIEKIEDSLHIGQGANKVLQSNDAVKASELLSVWRQKLYALSDVNGHIDFKTLKKVVMGIDQDMRKYGARGASEFSEAAESAMYLLRKELDTILKDVPGYGDKMAEVAKLTELLSKVNKRFPDQRATQSKISGIHRPTSQLDYDDLAALSSATGNNFIGDIDEFVKAQRLLGDRRRLETMAAQSPEAAELAKHEARLARMQHPDYGRDFVDGAVKSSGLLDDQAAAIERARLAEEKLAAAQAMQSGVGLTPTGGEALVNSLMRDKSPFNSRTKVVGIDQKMGTKLAQEIDDRRILDSFEKGNTNGSRNVNLFSVMGHAVGTGVPAGIAAGSVAGPIGMVVGAIGGAVVDKFGPQMAKGILDQVIKIQGTPTAQKIQALSLPPEVKNFVSNQLVKHQLEVVRGNSVRAARNTPKELDRDSSTPSQERVPEDEARKQYLQGN